MQALKAAIILMEAVSDTPEVSDSRTVLTVFLFVSHLAS